MEYLSILRNIFKQFQNLETAGLKFLKTLNHFKALPSRLTYMPFEIIFFKHI
jgi:hypothetical protein